MTDVILLALSVLPREERESEFSVEGSDFKGKYIGQLEPIIQYRINSGEQNDIEVLTLCTEETKNNSNTFASCSALSYFENRIEKIKADYSYPGSIKVTPIDILADDPAKGINDSVQSIRAIPERGELWIDTHGGFRDIALSLEAVISLLKVEDIVPDRIFGIRYDNQQAVLIDQKTSFEMFDFVSGMNEFINTGSVNQLNKYYELHNDPELKPVLDAMNTISNGTLECNPDQYISGLDALGKSISKLNNTDSLMGIFAEYIKDSYGVLLDPRKRTTPDILRRCVDKGLYQQALTLLETLMPQEFVDREILYYDTQVLASILGHNPKLKPAYEKESNFVVNSFVTHRTNNPFFLTSADPIPKTLNQEKEYIEILIDKKKKDNSKYEPSTGFLDPNNAASSKVISIGKDNAGNSVNLTIKTKVTTKNEREKAGKLMKMHKALKRCRNAFNHCNPDRASMEDIVAVLRKYIDLADELFDKYERQN